MPDPVLFSVLPKWKKPWRELILSYGTQAVAIAIFVWVPLLHPEIIESPKRDYHAIELVPTPVPVNHEPQRRLPKPVVVAKVEPPPATLHLAAPKPQPKPKAEDVPAPVVKLAERKVDLPPSHAPVIPKQGVRTNLFSSGSSAPQTIPDRPVQQVVRDTETERAGQRVCAESCRAPGSEAALLFPTRATRRRAGRSARPVSVMAT